MLGNLPYQLFTLHQTLLCRVLYSYIASTLLWYLWMSACYPNFFCVTMDISIFTLLWNPDFMILHSSHRCWMTNSFGSRLPGMLFYVPVYLYCITWRSKHFIEGDCTCHQFQQSIFVINDFAARASGTLGWSSLSWQYNGTLSYIVVHCLTLPIFIHCRTLSYIAVLCRTFTANSQHFSKTEVKTCR